MMLERLGWIREMLDHPTNRGARVGTLLRYLRWNVGRRLLSDTDYCIELLPGCPVLLSNGENYATLAYTCGLYDFEEMLFLLHFLREGDCFGDFGANVGVYSVLAGSRGARVLAAEPVPGTWHRLRRNLRMNEVAGIASNVGLADAPGRLRFTTALGGLNRVAPEASDTAGSSEVEVTTADLLVQQTGLAPCLLKVDVEGYELPLLEGAEDLLASTVRALIIELNGSGKRYGFADESVHAFLVNAGFDAMSYDPYARALVVADWAVRRGFNVLYVKRAALEEVTERLRAATPVVMRTGEC